MSEARRIWGLVLAMAGVGSGFIVVLRIGFAVSGGPAPAELESSVAAAGFILVLVLIYAVSAVLRLPPSKRWGWPMRRYRSPIRLSLSHRRFERERQHRLEQLARDPVRSKYLPRIQRGESWSDAQIEYDLDPTQLGTCLHLRPIERAIRSSGVPTKLVRQGGIDADCVIEPEALKAQFNLGVWLNYEEFTGFDRSLLDPPQARIICHDCQAWISTVHPNQATQVTLHFPATRGGNPLTAESRAYTDQGTGS